MGTRLMSPETIWGVFESMISTQFGTTEGCEGQALVKVRRRRPVGVHV